MTRILRAASVLSLSACTSIPRHGLAPMVTDRPDFTESSETVARGIVQVESGITVAREGDIRAAAIGEALVRVGLSPRAELRVGLNSYAVERQAGMTVHGLEDMSLGAKVKLLEGGATGSARPTVAVIVASSLPTGASPFRAPSLQPEVKLAGAWTLSERVSFSSNVNYAWVREQDATYGEPSASASLGVGLSDRVGSYLEYYGFYPRIDGATRTHVANGGLTVALTDNTQLDWRVGSQLRRTTDGASYFVGVGLTRRW